MLTLLNAMGILIVAIGGAALGFLLAAMIDDLMTKKK